MTTGAAAPGGAPSPRIMAVEKKHLAFFMDLHSTFF
jgi:hypothetical protein